MLDAITDEVLDLPVNLTTPEDPLFLEQLALEKEMFDGGIERFLRAEQTAQKRGEAGVGGRFLLRRLHNEVTTAIASFRHTAKTAPGPRNTSLALIGGLEDQVVAYIALRATLHAVANAKAGVTLQTLAYRIGEAVEVEVWTREFRRKNPELFRVTEAEMEKHSADRQRHIIARKMARQAGAVPGEWTRREMILLGTKMVDLIREATGLIRLELVRTSSGRDALYRVFLSPAAEEKVAAVSDTAATMFPYYMPTIIPPKPWTSNSSGGYHGPYLLRHRLVKTRVKEVAKAMRRLPEVLAAVNAVQDTPWRVNTPVLEVLRECFATERAVAGLAARGEELPPFPSEAEKDPEMKKLWKRAAAQTHDRNRRAFGRRLQVATAIRLAEKFQHRPAIWFPHQMDFRGRIYPIPNGLTPQGTDYQKALLTFARGYPITDEVAAGWLMVSGAGRYGVDKCSLVDRIAWVEKHEEAILEAAKDPMGAPFDFWAEADEPFQFLAFCFEWAAFKAHGWGYESSLPVNLDGTCNGLQHYSAALRDAVGGAAVNLLPSDKPNDIYGVVAARSEELVRAFLDGDAPDDRTIADLPRLLTSWQEKDIDPHFMAQAWLEFGFDRSLVKRAVMTLPYGSTNYSCREFLEEALKKALDKGSPNPFTPSKDRIVISKALFRATLWLQPIVWQAIGETVKAAREGMTWLQKCASLVTAGDVPVKWTTPDGFPVAQAYRSVEHLRVRTMVDGGMVSLTVHEETLAVDRRAQQQGVAPNWVHSMDACALRKFVVLAKDNGLEDFCLIHDSYGAPAAKVELMNACIREAFISLYTDQDPMLEFYFDVLDQVDADGLVKLTEPPAKGSLDLSQLRKADYFFA